MNRIFPAANALASHQFSTALKPNFSASDYHETIKRSLKLGPKLKEDQTSLTSIEKALTSNICSVLPILGLNVPRGNKQMMVAMYMTSHLSLQVLANEVEEFLRSLIEIVIEPRGFASDFTPECIQFTRQELIGDNSLYLHVPPPIVSSDLVVLPDAVVLLRLQRDIEHRVHDVVKHFLRLLCIGAERNWIGMVTWLDSTTCRFVYCKAPIIPLNKELKDQRRVSGAIHSRYSANYQHRLGLHEQHLMNAVIAPGIPEQTFLPKRLHQPIAKIPSFAIPLIGTLDGLLIRERSIEWEFCESTSEIEEIQKISSRGPEWDPAIVLGPFVLLGWSARDFDIPSTRKERVQNMIRWLIRPSRSLNIRNHLQNSLPLFA